MIMQDRWNMMYLLSMLTFIAKGQQRTLQVFQSDLLHTSCILILLCKIANPTQAGLILRGASLVSYEKIFNINVKAFKAQGCIQKYPNIITKTP